MVVREVSLIVAGISVGLAWLAIWGGVLYALGFAPFRRKAEDCSIRRERLKHIGKLKYIAVFGVLGPGLAFGLALTTADVLRGDSVTWAAETAKLVFLTVFFGLFQGVRSWREAFRDSVPSPHLPISKIS